MRLANLTTKEGEQVTLDALTAVDGRAAHVGSSYGSTDAYAEFYATRA